MGHTPYGYIIENGKAVIDETAAEKLRTLFDNYLNGMSLQTAAKAAEIETYHGTVKRIITTKHYIGDEFYPSIIDQQKNIKSKYIQNSLFLTSESNSIIRNNRRNTCTALSNVRCNNGQYNGHSCEKAGRK